MSQHHVPVSALADAEVLALADSQMLPEQDERISQLLYKQQAGQLTDPERSELAGLMQIYQEGLLRKAQGLSEAVKRGLREQLEP